ncbi:MAG TPA: response regulator [Clostridiaceae bacterium]|nr:response regulator [Clostridiaceae bacterium]
MNRLLLVDDEPDIVDGLYEVFCQESGLELDVYKAYSGIEAIEKMKSMRFDIVVTDIKMPGITGLQLLDTIYNYWPKCKVIMLTGYSEFDYVYATIHKPGAKYILKTEGDAAIIEAVRECMEENRKEHEREAIMARARNQFAKSLPFVRNKLFTSLLDGDIPEEWDKQFSELETGLNPEQKVLLVAARPLFHSDVRNLQQFSYIQNEVEYQLGSKVTSYCIEYYSLMVWFIQPQAESEWDNLFNYVKGSFEAAQITCHNELGVGLPLAMASEPAEWTDLAGLIDRLKALLFINPLNSMTIFTDEGAVCTASEEYSNLERSFYQLEQLLDNNAENFTTELRKLLEVARSSGGMLYSEILFRIMGMLFSRMNRKGIMPSEIEAGIIELLAGLEKIGFGASFIETMANKVLASKVDDDEGKVVQKIKSYISENLEKDLSLTRLAEVVYLNPSYLSRLYKQITGENLSDYITERRIAHARELLTSTNMKISDISAAVGINNPAYFSILFKRYTGISPQQYRNAQ